MICLCLDVFVRIDDQRNDKGSHRLHLEFIKTGWQMAVHDITDLFIL